VYLAAYQVILAAAAGTDVVVTGCPVANRADPAFSDTVGFIANLVPVPAHFDWTATARAHLATAARATAEALGHSEVPYGLVAEHTGSAVPAPLFDALFTLQQPPAHPLVIPGCVVREVEPAVWPLPYPMMLDVQERGQDGTALLRFDARVLPRTDADRIAAAYPLTLAALCSLPDLQLDRLRRLLRTRSPETSSLLRERLRTLHTQEGPQGDQ
jgi:hypothetical protein